MLFRPLPWEYGIRNLFRRPLRSALTLTALTTVTLLVLVVVGFIRGLERTLNLSADQETAYVFSLGMGENLEYSSIPYRTADLLAASLSGIRSEYGQKLVSPELYLGTQVRLPGDDSTRMGLIRGVTPQVLLVNNRVQIESGRWPRTGEVLVGRLASTKLGLSADQLTAGQSLEFEGKTWQISGTFAAVGGAMESEIWCRLDELQQAMKRQDLSLVAVRLSSAADFQDVDLFCKERLDLELQAIRQPDYYASLNQDYAPVRWLSWSIIALIAGSGIFVGLNTMYGSIVGRISEIAMLQTLGFSRRAAILSVMHEGVILAMAAALLASLLALFFANGVAIRFTLEAFQLKIDSIALLIGNLIALLLGIGGTIPPAIRIARMSVVDSLKSV